VQKSAVDTKAVGERRQQLYKNRYMKRITTELFFPKSRHSPCILHSFAVVPTSRKELVIQGAAKVSPKIIFCRHPGTIISKNRRCWQLCICRLYNRNL